MKSASFEFAVWGDGLSEWLTAAALAMAGRSAALLLTRPLDRESGAFPGYPADLAGSEIIANHFGEAPAGAADNPWQADLQVVWPGRRLDIFADPVEFFFGLNRDAPDQARPLITASTGLRKVAEKIEREILARADYPPFAWRERFLYRFKGIERAVPQLGRTLNDLLHEHGVAEEMKWLFLLPLKALCPDLRANPGLGTAAVLWNFLLRQQRGTGSADLRLRLREIIRRNGEVFESPPDRVALHQGGVRAVLLANKTEVQPRILIAEPAAVFAVLDPAQREETAGRKLALLFPRLVRHTLFFRVERAALPEAMARRVVVLNDPAAPLEGPNFLTLCRIPRVPRWETLAVTATYPKGDVPPPPPEELLHALHWLFPFLGRDQVEIEPERPPLSRHHYALPKHAGFFPRHHHTPLKNVFLPPDQVLPGLGPQANFLFISALMHQFPKPSA